MGTAASYDLLLEGTGMSAAQLEARIMEKLGLRHRSELVKLALRHGLLGAST